MTCKQLGGACDVEFYADTFEEIAELSKKHGREMLKESDKAHFEAMSAMKIIMASPDTLQAWFKIKRSVFDALPNER